MQRPRQLILAAAMTLAAAAGPCIAATQPPNVDDRPDIAISAADRALAIRNLAQTIRQEHYSPNEGARIASAIERLERRGRYAGIGSGRAMASALTRDLRTTSGDQHFLVDYFARARPYPAPAEKAAPAPTAELRLTNFGVVSVDRLAGNIGYLRIDRFVPAAEAAPVIDGALAVLRATEALVIDLRRNGGGHAATAAFLAARLLPEPARMSDIIARGDVKQFWTPVIAGGGYEKPVYVLVSSRTFSAAEGFAYDLRALKRVTIVGETTRGGANPVSRSLLSSHFWVLVPSAQARNPLTHASWEGTGVVPDIKVAADAALDAATLDAARNLLPLHPDDPLTRELEAIVAGKE